MATLTAEQVIAIWETDVRSRGNVPTYFPNGPYVQGTTIGQRAERYIDSYGHARYAAAPPDVEAVYEAILAQERTDISAAEKLDLLTRSVQNATRWVVTLPKTIIDAALGIPAWVIPGLLLGAAVLLLVRKTR